ncbi:MAG TPA: DUF5655 domain-containing protein [Candidatus Limnocylindrales bacterium]
MTRRTRWVCPECGAPFATTRASHSCVRIALDARFATADPAVRTAFDRLVELASVDGPIPVVAQKTRIVLAAPMRFLAVEVRRDRLRGHVFLERAVPHPLITEIVPDAYGSRLVMHRFEIRDAAELDAAFAALVREAAERVGRRTRLRS